MKKLIFAVLGLVAVSSLLLSCKEKEETYAEQKEREARQVREWIDSHDIDCISLQEFLKDTVTDNPEISHETSMSCLRITAFTCRSSVVATVIRSAPAIHGI